MKNHKYFFIISRFILGVVFIYASIDKIANPKVFAEIISNYQILPNELINLTAIILPWLEIIIGISLVFGFWQYGAIIISNLLLLSFIAALLFNLARGINVNCGCFSTSGKSAISWLSIMRDLSFLFLSFYLFLKKFTKVNKGCLWKQLILKKYCAILY